MELPEHKKIILFDGVCNLCNRAVQFVIRHDRKDLFRFAPLQGETGRALAAARGIDTAKVDSILLIDPETACYFKSTAAIEIGKSFGGAWRLLAMFSWIPRGIRDRVYDLIAERRYRWFGKRDECMVPTTELRARFLP